MHNSIWHLPQSLLNSIPNLRHLVTQVTLPSEPKEDRLVWKHCASWVLSLKEAYMFKYGSSQNIPWEKQIWCANIPPSKSLMTWRLMHNKLPIDDNLIVTSCFPNI